MDPAVSVIIPNYNHARFLERRIRGVLAQTYQDIELILLDDASTDGSWPIIQQFASDPRVRVACRNPTNSGTSFAQWNRGVALARGRYVWIAESDDDAEPTFLETMVRLLDAHPHVGLAYCRSMQIDEQDRPLGTMDYLMPEWDAARWESDFINNGLDECRRYLFFRNSIPNASAVLFRRSVYLEAGQADAGLRLTGDWKLWFAMLLRSDIAYTSRVLNRFRTHPGSVRRRSLRRQTLIEEECQVLSYMRQHLDVSGDVLRRRLDELSGRWWAGLWDYGASFPHLCHMLRLLGDMDPSLLDGASRQAQWAVRHGRLWFAARLCLAVLAEGPLQPRRWAWLAGVGGQGLRRAWRRALGGGVRGGEADHA